MPSPQPALPSIDPAACPLCGQLNRCAMEVARASGRPPEACWCAEVDFSADLLARVPAPAQRLACICEACARRGEAA